MLRPRPSADTGLLPLLRRGARMGTRVRSIWTYGRVPRASAPPVPRRARRARSYSTPNSLCVGGGALRTGAVGAREVGAVRGAVLALVDDGVTACVGRAAGGGADGGVTGGAGTAGPG